MSSSRGNSDMSTNENSNTAVPTPHDMSTPNKKKGRKEGTPVPGARGVLLPSKTFDTAAEAEWKVFSESAHKKNSKAVMEAGSLPEAILAAQNATPSQKRKRISFKELVDIPNRLLSPVVDSGSDQQQEPGAPPLSHRKKRLGFVGTPGLLKRTFTPAQDAEATVQKPKTTTKTPKAVKTHKTPKASIAPQTPATTITPPTIPKFPKLPSTPTYHSDIPKPTSPEPVDGDSFHDLVEENNQLRIRVQAFEKLDDMILDATAPIGAITFSDHADAHNIDPVRQTLLAIDRPAAEACLVILDKLAETQAGLAASRAEGVDMDNFTKFDEVGEEAYRGKILMERIGLLEESNEVLGVEKDELTRMCMSKHITAQDMGRHIRALVDTNKRFKAVQDNDKETIAKLQQEIEDLDGEKRGLEQHKAKFAESAEAYIMDIQKLCEGETAITAKPPFTTEAAARRSEAYLAENKKAVEGLAGVMDILKGKDDINAVVPPYPLAVLVGLVRGYTTTTVRGKTRATPIKRTTRSTPKPKNEETLTTKKVETLNSIIESLGTIAEDDPCKDIKILLGDNQAGWQKRQKEWDNTLQTLTKERDSLKDNNEELHKFLRAAETYSSSVNDIAAANLASSEEKHATSLKKLEAEIQKHVELQVKNEEDSKGVQVLLSNLTTSLADSKTMVERQRSMTAASNTENARLKQDLADAMMQLNLGSDPTKKQSSETSEPQATSAGILKALQADVDRLWSILAAAETNNLKNKLLKLTTLPENISKTDLSTRIYLDKQVKKLQTEVAKLKSVLLTQNEGGAPGEQLLDRQAVADKKNEEMRSLRAKIDMMKGVLATGILEGSPEGDPCAEVKKQLLELQAASRKKDEYIKFLQTKTSIPVTKTPRDDPCAKVKNQLLELQGRHNTVRRRLKICKNKHNTLERKLAKLEARKVAPFSDEFEKRVRILTNKQKLTYVKRINMLYNTKQEQMFPPARLQSNGQPVLPLGTLRGFLRQDGPPIKEISDLWFAAQWDELYDQVTILCQINYRGRSDHLPYDYGKSAAEDELLSYYLRDTVLSENAMHDHINSVTEIFGHTYRAKVAVAIVFRILVEEIFNPIRFLLNMRFPESGRWKSKLHFKQAFEELDNPAFPRAATKRGFQEKESWYTRQAAMTGKEVYHPSRRRDGNFNYFKQIEEINYNWNDGGKVVHRF